MILKARGDAFGSGGAPLQKLHRDTHKCDIKCSYARVGNEERVVVRDPITDPGKKARKGKLTFECVGGMWTTVTEGRGRPRQRQAVGSLPEWIVAYGRHLCEYSEALGAAGCEGRKRGQAIRYHGAVRYI